MYLSVALPVPLFKTFDYLPPADFSDDPESLIGRRVLVPFGFRKMGGIVCGIKETTEAPDKIKPALQFLDEEPVLDTSLLELGRWLSWRYVCPPGDALFALLPPGKRLAVSKDAGAPHDSFEYHSLPDNSGHELSEDQKKAAAEIHEAVFAHESRVFLLHGVAAAGKTEVYMSAIKDALAQGKNALYLAPEIGLAVQAAETLKRRFGEDRVLLWHSDVSQKTRVADWWRIRRAEAPIVVGARSAALAPLPHLGVIIVDEEQDSAYKEERKPRFHVRDVAIKRAKDHSATVIFGSATPSLEILHEALDRRAELVELDERVVPAAAPNIRILDVRGEKMFGGSLSPVLEAAIGERLKNKQQVILFLNRRGFYRFLRCPHCGWVARCPNCNIAMVEHKGSASSAVPRSSDEDKTRHEARGTRNKKRLAKNLLCHTCAHQEPAPAACLECKHPKLHAGGFGTERVTDEVTEKFPWAKIVRWDRDATSATGDHERRYRSIVDGDVDIIIGTQMVAQGFDFPKVTLVGVVDADVSLHLPDFRAAERTFQVLTQVAGRAGRSMVTGDVIIQTRNPDHFALGFASRADYAGFAEYELTFRRDLNYPPFTHVVQIRSDARKAEQAKTEIDSLVAWVSELNPQEPIGIIGPHPAREGKSQWAITLKIPETSFQIFLDEFARFLASKSRKLWIDIDPL